jgi:ribose-phosphate pyrophosphokinase
MIMGATHAVLCGNARDNLTASGVQRFVVTDTVRIGNAKQMDSIKVISVAPLIAEAIKRIHTGESVGALFR